VKLVGVGGRRDGRSVYADEHTHTHTHTHTQSSTALDLLLLNSADIRLIAVIFTGHDDHAG
jgi:hypothetical protein